MGAIQVLRKAVLEKNMIDRQTEISSKEQRDRDKNNNSRRRTKCLLKCQQQQQQQQCDPLTTNKNVSRQAFNMYTHQTPVLEATSVYTEQQ
jgi:hypothetical protein